MKQVIRNCSLVQDGQILPRDITIDGSVITDIGPVGSGAGAVITEADGLYLSHGFIDIHVHGGGGADFMDGTEDAWFTAARLHMRHGTTCMTPTTLSASDEELENAFSIFNKRKNTFDGCARLLGLHLEGPYFSPAQSGAQDPAHLRTPDPANYRRMLALCPDIVRWSLAPELPGGLEMGRELARQGITAAIGHSDATCAQVQQAVEAGFTHITHLYSATSTITRVGGFRRGGIVEAAYLLPQLTSEIIADGCHLPAELLQLTYRFIGPSRLALITDAMRGAGQHSGTSILGSLKCGQQVIIEDGVAKMPDRKAFAGSVCTTDRLVRNMIQMAGASLPDAVAMATQTPARIIGRSNITGRVAPGRNADLVLFDDQIRIQKVWVNGSLCHDGGTDL